MLVEAEVVRAGSEELNAHQSETIDDGEAISIHLQSALKACLRHRKTFANVMRFVIAYHQTKDVMCESKSKRPSYEKDMMLRLVHQTNGLCQQSLCGRLLCRKGFLYTMSSNFFSFGFGFSFSFCVSAFLLAASLLAVSVDFLTVVWAAFDDAAGTTKDLEVKESERMLPCLS